MIGSKCLSRRRVIALPLALALGTRQGTPQTTPPPDVALATFATFIDEAMGRLGVPGVAVAVVRDDGVIFAQGFGVRGLDDASPVTPDTLLMVDSLTKPLTTLLAASLVEEGLAGWETPARDLLPDFSIGSNERPPLTLANLFCHCAGVPRNDAVILFNAASITPQRLIAMAADLPVNAPVGERYQYSNHLFAIGGYGAAAAARPNDDLRAAYHAAMRERLLGPVGMGRSTFLLEVVMRDGDYATPAAPTLTGEVQPVPLEGEETFADAVEPAGGLWSTAREMAQVLLMLLAGGVSPDGERVVSPESLETVWQMRVALPPNPVQPPLLNAAMQGYGLGWYTGEYAGQRLLSHSGGVSGFVSQLALLPEAGLGVVVLTNGAGAHALATAAPFRLFELLLGQPPQVEDLLQQQMAAARQQAEQRLDQLGQVDPAAVEPFLGQYVSERLGEATLSLADGRLLLDAGEVRSPLLPRLDDAGQVTEYHFVAPPLASLPVALYFKDEADGQPTLTLATAGQTGASYTFTPRAAPAATPQPP